MSIGDAWDSMDSSTKNLVIEIYNRYGYSGADENELKRVLRR